MAGASPPARIDRQNFRSTLVWMAGDSWLVTSSPLSHEAARLVHEFLVEACARRKGEQALALVRGLVAAGKDAIEHYGTDATINGNYRIHLQATTFASHYEHSSGQATTRLKVSATGAWQIVILPIAQARKETIPGIITGKGDDVIILLGDTPDTAQISGNKGSRYFSVQSYASDGSHDLLVNTTDPYDGQVMLNNATMVIEVQATGDWSIQVATK